MINAYLTNATELDDHAIHLLFSANRWEKVSAIQSALAAGTTIVCDRYAASGVAFSSAKPGMSMQWCKQSDAGLPAPDHVFFLDVPPDVAARRGGFGGERYEVAPFQLKVRENFSELMVRSPRLGFRVYHDFLRI
jgi:dTMP kinase